MKLEITNVENGYVINRIEEGISKQFVVEGKECNSESEDVKIKEKVVCFYHNDMDGITSASIVKQRYPDAKYIKVSSSLSPFLCPLIILLALKHLVVLLQ